MVKTRVRNGSIFSRGQSRHGVSTLMHGQLAIELGNIPYSGLLPTSDVGSPHLSSYSSTPSSTLSSSNLSSSGHQHFLYVYPHSTISPNHTHISSSSTLLVLHYH